MLARVEYFSSLPFSAFLRFDLPKPKNRNEGRQNDQDQLTGILSQFLYYFLEQVVLGEIRRLTRFASKYETEFVKAVMGHSHQAIISGLNSRQRELNSAITRDKELDGLFERIYEDNVNGKISDERFQRMTKRYEDEQREILERIKGLKIELEKLSSQSMTTDMFIATVRKYTRARKLTPHMLNELIERIEVYHAEKINGAQVQKIRIHYNCVGSIGIPDVLPLPEPDVCTQTRKGVAVSYAPAQVAV